MGLLGFCTSGEWPCDDKLEDHDTHLEKEVRAPTGVMILATRSLFNLLPKFRPVRVPHVLCR